MINLALLARYGALQQELAAYRKGDWKRFDLVRNWRAAGQDDLPRMADAIEAHIKSAAPDLWTQERFDLLAPGSWGHVNKLPVAGVNGR